MKYPRNYGKVKELGPNLFHCVRGRQFDALTDGLHVAVIESYLNQDLASTPSGSYALARYENSPTLQRMYSNAVAHGTAALGAAPILKLGDRLTAVAYMFLELGRAEGQADRRKIDGKWKPLRRYNPALLRSCFKSMCGQLKQAYPDQELRIGLPRLYGGVAGLHFDHLVQVLRPITSLYPEYKFFIFTSSTPDGSLVNPLPARIS